MPKILLLTLSLTVVVLTAVATIVANSYFSKPLSKSEIDIAVNQARYLYNQKKSSGEDLSLGPCLSNALLPNWVLDIAHNPRQTIDDLPQNQCPAFREGRAAHFVELDPEGNLIRAR
ncbi:hypothetical protein KKE03_01635 [Patescibacteria group bacterium]|nr:hypothetical protein [Patescibacteria group bacterium]